MVHLFQSDISGIPLPEAFTFPFVVQTHPLCRIAAAQLQAHLAEYLPANWHQAQGYGKMFGVLVVQRPDGVIGYLAAFSGKLMDSNHHEGFVPPVFDLLDRDGFFKKGEAQLNALNARIEWLLNESPLRLLETQEQRLSIEAQEALAAEKQLQKETKASRQARREAAAQMADCAEKSSLSEQLMQESRQDHFRLKDLKRHWQQQKDRLNEQIAPLREEVSRLKTERRQLSAALQQQIFDHYTFVNIKGEQRSIGAIFPGLPPAGAGECAAPKLLQYAFLQQLRPVAMAEFWWGPSPPGAVRREGYFYPACRSKCEPVLEHVLSGMTLEANTVPGSTAAHLSIEVLYEDDDLVVIHKPDGLLSVPGKSVMDSVWFRMKKKYPQAEGPLIVHRLDLSTSGLMLIAKNEAAYKLLQQQFLTRKVKKRYVALLDGIVQADEGRIELPLRVDLDNRPRQMVCHEHGKSAITLWEVIARTDMHTRVHFYPLTGRTHQLRVHAAHPDGLNAPIVGDELYGLAGNRLHLHAESLALEHPVTGEALHFSFPANF